MKGLIAIGERDSEGSMMWGAAKHPTTRAEITACRLMDATDGVREGDFLKKHPMGWVTADYKSYKDAEYWINREFLALLEEE